MHLTANRTVAVLPVFCAILFKLANSFPVYSGEKHIILGDEIVGDKRVLVIGDVHGALDELKAILKKVGALSSDETSLNGDIIAVLTGDAINKGPKNLETLHFIKNSGIYQVRGNHEENILKDAKRSGNKKFAWTTQLTTDDIAYLKSLPYTITLSKYNTTVVHAGILPGVSLADQEINTLTRMRNIKKTKTGKMIANEEKKKGKAWIKFWKGPKSVVFGHNASRGLQISPFAMGLDSNCYRGGELTGIFLPIVNKELISVKCGNYCLPDNSNC